VEAAVAIIRDVTDLSRLDELRDQFFASAAHTIKTPVAILKAQLQLSADSGVLGLRARAIMERQCGRLDRLIDNVLAIQRIHQRALQLYPTNVELATLLGEVSAEMSGASANHRLETSITGRPVVFADPERLALLVRDMIELAYRRARPGAVVSVDASRVDARVKVSVAYDSLTSHVTEHTDGAGFTQLGLETAVIEAIANATNGVLRTHTESRRRVDSLELPAVIEEAHARI
jgi:signal transduction histidine kinase